MGKLIIKKYIEGEHIYYLFFIVDEHGFEWDLGEARQNNFAETGHRYEGVIDESEVQFNSDHELEDIFAEYDPFSDVEWVINDER